MPIIDVNQLPLHYRFDGPEDAEVLVFINSIATDLSIWDETLAALQNSFRVLRFDARGQGQSGVPEGPYSIAMLGQDLLALLEALDIPVVHVCGLSLGAMVGMWLATHHPQRVGKLVLCNTAAYVGPPAAWDARAAAVREQGMAAVRPAVLQRWLSAPFLASHPAATEQVVGMVQASPTAGYIGSCAAIRDMDQRGTIAAIAALTLVVAGSADAATTPADARYIAATIPRATYTELPGGHLSNVEQPQRLGEEIRKFLLA